MVNVKEAVRSATTFLQDMYPAANDLLLEEVEFDGPQPTWRVVLSFERSNARPTGILGSVIGSPSRIFKVVELDPDGKAQKIKVWKQ